MTRTDWIYILLFNFWSLSTYGFAIEETPDILKIFVTSSPGIYQEEEQSWCDLNPYFTFGAEILHGKIQKAVLRVNKESLPLLKSEIEAIELYRDRHSRLWFKRLTLSERVIIWLIDKITVDRTYLGYRCGPKASIKTVESQSVQFEFDTELLGEGVYSSRSNELIIKGRTTDYADYKITMRLVQ